MKWFNNPRVKTLSKKMYNEENHKTIFIIYITCLLFNIINILI